MILFFNIPYSRAKSAYRKDQWLGKLFLGYGPMTTVVDGLSALGYQDLEQLSFDIIINATSASLSGHLPPISTSIISQNVVCYDMVYGKDETPFLKWAKEHGALKVIDGLGMLVGQAAVSFEVWRGVAPKVQPVIDKLRAALT